jgi:hypothetical protein
MEDHPMRDMAGASLCRRGGRGLGTVSVLSRDAVGVRTAARLCATAEIPRGISGRYPHRPPAVRGAVGGALVPPAHRRRSGQASSPGEIKGARKSGRLAAQQPPKRDTPPPRTSRWISGHRTPEKMRVLVIYAHPLPDSLASALHRVIIELAAQSTRMEYRGADTSSAA